MMKFHSYPINQIINKFRKNGTLVKPSQIVNFNPEKLQKVKSESIEKIRKRFSKRRQWLLILVDEMDETTTTPVRGRLIAHGRSYETVASINYPGHTYLTCSKRYSARRNFIL